MLMETILDLDFHTLKRLRQFFCGLFYGSARVLLQIILEIMLIADGRKLNLHG